jgi:hypothetical protein
MAITNLSGCCCQRQCVSKSVSLPFEPWENKNLLQIKKIQEQKNVKPYSQQRPSHQKLSVSFTGGYEEPKKQIENAITLQLELDQIYLKINEKFQDILSEFTNEQSLRLRITPLIQGKCNPT